MRPRPTSDPAARCQEEPAGCWPKHARRSGSPTPRPRPNSPQWPSTGVARAVPAAAPVTRTPSRSPLKLSDIGVEDSRVSSRTPNPARMKRTGRRRRRRRRGGGGGGGRGSLGGESVRRHGACRGSRPGQAAQAPAPRPVLRRHAAFGRGGPDGKDDKKDPGRAAAVAAPRAPGGASAEGGTHGAGARPGWLWRRDQCGREPAPRWGPRGQGSQTGLRRLIRLRLSSGPSAPHLLLCVGLWAGGARVALQARAKQCSLCLRGRGLPREPGWGLRWPARPSSCHTAWRSAHQAGQPSGGSAGGSRGGFSGLQQARRLRPLGRASPPSVMTASLCRDPVLPPSYHCQSLAGAAAASASCAHDPAAAAAALQSPRCPLVYPTHHCTACTPRSPRPRPPAPPPSLAGHPSTTASCSLTTRSPTSATGVSHGPCDKRPAASEELLSHLRTHGGLPRDRQTAVGLPQLSSPGQRRSGCAMACHMPSPRRALRAAPGRWRCPAPPHALGLSSRYLSPTPEASSPTPGAPVPVPAATRTVLLPYALYGQRLTTASAGVPVRAIEEAIEGKKELGVGVGRSRGRGGNRARRLSPTRGDDRARKGKYTLLYLSTEQRPDPVGRSHLPLISPPKLCKVEKKYHLTFYRKRRKK